MAKDKKYYNNDLIYSLMDLFEYRKKRSQQLVDMLDVDWEHIVKDLRRTDISTREKRNNFYKNIGDNDKSDMMWTRFIGDF